MAGANSTPDYKYIAYIDESGDPGLRRVKPLDSSGSSEWMMVAAVVIAAERESELPEWIADLTSALDSHQLRQLHFQKLTAARKLIACQRLSSHPVRCFVVASNKRNMRGWTNPFAEKIPSDNWYYCWMTRLLLERVTHWVRHHSEKEHGAVQRVKLVYSERGGLSYSQLTAYYEWLRSKGDNQVLTLGNLEYETIHMQLIEVINHAGHDGLKLPDIVASAFFKAADVHDTGGCDTSFAAALEPRMARWPNNKHGLISGYGVKLMPGYKNLTSKVQPEQLAIFGRYGYPKQWWQAPGPSNPPPTSPALVSGVLRGRHGVGYLQPDPGT